MDPFTIDNLPYGVISTANNTNKRCAIAFGDSAIDVEQLYQEGFFSSVPELRNDVFHVSISLLSELRRLTQLGQLERIFRLVPGYSLCVSSPHQVRHTRWLRRQGHDPAVYSTVSPPNDDSQLLRLLLLLRACQQRKLCASRNE